MEIKITIIQDQKPSVTRDFAFASDAIEYLSGIVPAESEAKIVEDEKVSDESKDFTNDQEFDIGQRVEFFSTEDPQFNGVHVIEEERQEEVGHSYRTDRSGDGFIHAHWFKPVREA